MHQGFWVFLVIFSAVFGYWVGRGKWQFRPRRGARGGTRRRLIHAVKGNRDTLIEVPLEEWLYLREKVDSEEIADNLIAYWGRTEPGHSGRWYARKALLESTEANS